MKSSVASTLKKVADFLRGSSILVAVISAFLLIIVVSPNADLPFLTSVIITGIVWAVSAYLSAYILDGFSLVVEACFLYIREIDPKEADELTTITQKKEPEETALPMD